MADIQAINNFIATQVAGGALTAVEMARRLDAEGLLNDSASKPGLPLRKLCRLNLIPLAYQVPDQENGKWFIGP